MFLTYVVVFLFLRPRLVYLQVRWAGCLLSNDVVMNVIKF